MAIKKRTSAAKEPSTYVEFRAWHWAKQPKDGVDFRGSVRNGKALTVNLLQPMPNPNFQDIWHCTSNAAARKMAQKLLDFEDVGLVNLKHKWVWVKPDGLVDFPLPGQDDDKRKRVTG